VKENGIYVKSGTILPMLAHDEELSILRAFNNPIELEVYIDVNRFDAKGRIILDDGLSTNAAFTEVLLKYENNVLSIGTGKGSTFDSGKKITRVRIYGLGSHPREILCLSSTLACKDIILTNEYDREVKSSSIALNYTVPATETEFVDLFEV